MSRAICLQLSPTPKKEVISYLSRRCPNKISTLWSLPNRPDAANRNWSDNACNASQGSPWTPTNTVTNFNPTVNSNKIQSAWDVREDSSKWANPADEQQNIRNDQPSGSYFIGLYHWFVSTCTRYIIEITWRSYILVGLGSGIATAWSASLGSSGYSGFVRPADTPHCPSCRPSAGSPTMFIILGCRRGCQSDSPQPGTST